jgi:hypothetical protein
MDKFMFLYVGGNMENSGLSPKEMEEHNQKWYSWIGGLAKEGVHLAGEPLLKGGKIVSGKDNKFVVTDGPFPESKELIGGYSIINAEDIDKAAEIAKGCPIYELGGTVQIRSIVKMDM